MSHPLARSAVAAVLLAAAAAAPAAGDPDEAPTRPPAHLFVQLGVAESAYMAVIGATWAPAWQRRVGHGWLGLHWETSFGRWRGEAEPGTRAAAWVTQIGITPVLRWVPDGTAGRGFLEAGIGANLLLPVYRSRDKRFSTTFNFGDHLAAGWRFGAQAEHEWSLRLQHFSNAGIRRPNPGEDFLQLRYARPL